MATPVWNATDNGYTFGASGPQFSSSEFLGMTPDTRMGYENTYNNIKPEVGNYSKPSISLTDQTYALENGGTGTQAGWGNLALGVGGLASSWIMGNKQLDLGREQLDFSKEEFYKNYAMQMDQYTRAANKNSGMLNWHNSDDGSSAGSILSDYNYGDRFISDKDSSINLADPSTDRVDGTNPNVASSSFIQPGVDEKSATSAEQSLLLNDSMYGNDVMTPEMTASSYARRRKARTNRDSNTEQQQQEQDEVQKKIG